MVGAHEPNRVASIACVVALAAGCGGGSETAAVAVYVDPVADAGPDLRALLGESFVLDGRFSTADPSARLAYTWAFEEVPLTSALDDTAFGATNGTPAAETVGFTPDVEGAYVVSLSVSDGVTASARDIAVFTALVSNLPPVADAGTAEVGQVGALQTFDGSRSFDPDGALTEYAWELAAAPAGSALTTESIFQRDTAGASLVPDAAGAWVLSLRVFDGIAWSNVDWLAFDVAPADELPVADAGTSRATTPCNGPTISLDGSGSYDPEGAPLIYQWALIGAPLGSAATAADLASATEQSTGFTWDLPGDYVFTLEVFDGQRWSAKDLVTVTVTDPATNQAPIAEGPVDFTVDQTMDCRTEPTGTVCEMCERLDFDLVAEGSYDPDGDAISYQWDIEGLEADTPDGAWTEVHPPPMPGAPGAGISTAHPATLTVSDCLASTTLSFTVTLTCKGS